MLWDCDYTITLFLLVCTQYSVVTDEILHEPPNSHRLDKTEGENVLSASV